jgi:FdhE protein
VTLDDWIREHAFLQPIARLRTRIDAAIKSAAIPHPPIPDWDDYREDFAAGVPLLHSADTDIDLGPAGAAVVALVHSLTACPLAGAIAFDVRVLSVELPRGDASARRVADWLIGDESWTPSRPGSLRYVGWLTMAACLRPVLGAFADWRDDDRWLRRYCPACGSLPAMAQLVGVEPGRRRLLSCGCCGSRWRYGRTGCPFCEVESPRLASFGIDGEGGLRIDYCESCRGYLKTYDGHGAEAVLLADWTSLHLDLAARDRGLQRLAASLYDVEPASAS